MAGHLLDVAVTVDPAAPSHLTVPEMVYLHASGSSTHKAQLAVSIGANGIWLGLAVPVAALDGLSPGTRVYRGQVTLTGENISLGGVSNQRSLPFLFTVVMTLPATSCLAVHCARSLRAAASGTGHIGALVHGVASAFRRGG